MRSELARKILSETPAEVKEFVLKQSEELVKRHKEIESIVLTDEEIRLAIWSAKITKWNKERNKEYWEKLEGKKSCAEKTLSEIKLDRLGNTDRPVVEQESQEEIFDDLFSQYFKMLHEGNSMSSTGEVLREKFTITRRK